MKITEALMEQMQATSAGDTDVMTVAPIAVNQQVLELLANSYVTVIVVIVVIVILVVGLAIYKSYTTWASTRTTRRRHSSRSSQQAWLYPDNPEMLDESLDSDVLPQVDEKKSWIMTKIMPLRFHRSWVWE